MPLSTSAVIPLLTHHHLPAPIEGTLSSIVPHGLDVEITLDWRVRFSILLEEARELVRQAGPNLRGRHLSYDGRCLVVREAV